MSELFSINPATLEKNTAVPATAAEDVPLLVQNAQLAWADWSRLPIATRAIYLLRARQFILDNLNRFAETITRETGKPLSEAITSELFPVADLLYHFAKKSERYLKDQRVGIGFMQLLFRKSVLVHPPYGVIGIIAPWNYPFAIPMGEIAMALVAGNTVVCKTSELTPLVSQLIVETWKATGLPEDVCTVLFGATDVGQALVTQPINKLFFTGSVGVGKQLAQQCGEHMTPAVFELGGKDAMIVLEDADIEQTSSGAVWGAFTNCGQACASVERIYVHSSIAERFIKRVVEKTKKLRVGNGLSPSIDVGPLAHEDQLRKVETHVEDARSRGAKILCGGSRLTDLPGYFYAPTVLIDVTHDFLCMREETFGPTLPIMTFTTDDQAISFANDSPYGLTASVWSRDIAHADAVARQLHAGTVTINECVYTHAICQTPWGGDGESGIGRSHGKMGLMECVRTHHLHLHTTRLRSLWWFPYNSRVVSAFKWMTKTMTGPIWKWALSLPAFGYLLGRKKL
ncbi:MAG: aldehyde dehydrogenase [Deltaproteobacteria bacterium CG11_big_fil_rev_8_21_14_0_20_47_16]|nr:MAG: aldehyde dehydrogenase [Deltaproteobacteria bacterium CG11_big_fil_rev_8_21_14_0_20_47_16]